MFTVRFLEHAVLTDFKGFLRLDQYNVRVPRYNGSLGQTQELVNVHRRDAVSGLLHIVGHGKQALLLVEQFRLPTIIRSDNGMPDFELVSRKAQRAGRLIELVAGVQRPGEPWLEAFRRECKEETGYIPDHTDVDHITSFYPSPGACSEQIHLYYGKIQWSDDDPWPRSDPETNDGQGDQTEDIRRIVIQPDKFLDMVASGQIVDGKCLAAAEWMRRNPYRFENAEDQP